MLVLCGLSFLCTSHLSIYILLSASLIDMGSLGRTLQIDLPRDWVNLALHRDVWRAVLSFEQCFILFCCFPLLFAFVVGGLGFELCVFVAGWRHALRSEWPFIIISSVNIYIIY